MPKLEGANASNLFDQIFNGLIKSIKKNDANALAAALKRYEQFGSDEYKTRLVEEGSDTTGQSLLAFALKNKAFHCFALLRDKGCACSPAVIKEILADSSEKQATIEAAIEQGYYDIAALFIGRPQQSTNCVVNDDEERGSDLTSKIATRLNELSKSGEQYQKRLQAMPEVSLYALLQNDTAKMMHDELPSHLTTPIMIDLYPEFFIDLINHDIHGEHVCASLYRKCCKQLGVWVNRDTFRVNCCCDDGKGKFADIVSAYSDIISDSVHLQYRIMALALALDGKTGTYSSILIERTEVNVDWQSKSYVENIMCTAALHGYAYTFINLYKRFKKDNRYTFDWYEDGALAKAIKILLNNNDYKLLNLLLREHVYYHEHICTTLSDGGEKHRSKEYTNILNYIVQLLEDASPSKTLAILLNIYYDKLGWNHNHKKAINDFLKELILQQVHELNTDEELIEQVCEKLSSNVESQLVDEKGNTFLHHARIYNIWPFNVNVLVNALRRSSDDFVFDDPDTGKLVKHMLETGQGMEYFEGDIVENYRTLCSNYLRFCDLAEAKSFFNAMIKNDKVSSNTGIFDGIIRSLYLELESIFRPDVGPRVKNPILNGKDIFYVALSYRYALNKIGFGKFIIDLLVNPYYNWTEDYPDYIKMLLEFIDEEDMSCLVEKTLEKKCFNILYYALQNISQHAIEKLLVDLLEKAPTVDEFYHYRVIDFVNYFKRCVQFVLATMSEETRSQITISNQTLMHLLANTHYDIIQKSLESGLQWELTASEALLENKQSIRLIKNLVFSCKLPKEMLTILARRYKQAVCEAIAEENYIQRCDDVAMASDFNRPGYGQNSAYAFMNWVDKPQGWLSINSLRKILGAPKIHFAVLVPSRHVKKNARNNPYINLFSEPTEQSTSKKQQVLQPREEQRYEDTCTSTSRFFTSVDEGTVIDDDVEKADSVPYHYKTLFNYTGTGQLEILSSCIDHIGIIQHVLSTSYLHVSNISYLREESINIIIEHICDKMLHVDDIYCTKDLYLHDVLAHALCKVFFNGIQENRGSKLKSISCMLAGFTAKRNPFAIEIVLGYFDEISSELGREYMENFLKDVLYDKLSTYQSIIHYKNRDIPLNKYILKYCRLSKEVRNIFETVTNNVQCERAAYSSLKY